MRKPIRIDLKLHSIDQLAWAPDDELATLVVNLEHDREAAINRGRNPMPWEVELSYILREIEIRQARKQAHAKWLLTSARETSNEGAN